MVEYNYLLKEDREYDVYISYIINKRIYYNELVKRLISFINLALVSCKLLSSYSVEDGIWRLHNLRMRSSQLYHLLDILYNQTDKSDIINFKLICISGDDCYIYSNYDNEPFGLDIVSDIAGVVVTYFTRDNEQVRIEDAQIT